MNRLATETSPYLRQHAHNPVDWFPWGAEALDLAKTLERPILLSIGYAACHWCHVMERESFEDAAVARMMNEHFVCIKVDREERPDLDAIYMHAVQAFTGGHGGWPMTVFLTPEGKPYFGGTYFPPTTSRGMPSFRQVLGHASHAWQERANGELARVTSEVLRILEQSGRAPAEAGDLDGAWLDRVASDAENHFDAIEGGFGGAPKFPPHGTLAALLVHHRVTGSARSLDMVTETLDAMARGAMYDLVGGGFARYSVDEFWRIPHFEKMLYDNAQLAPIYADAYLLTGRPQYARLARETLRFLCRDLWKRDVGAFMSSLDADTDGVEGATYVWTPEQLAQVLGERDARRVGELLEVSPHGNFEHGQSALRLDQPLETLATSDQALLGRALPMMLSARLKRSQPGLDDKVVASWNGLAAQAFARVGAAIGDDGRLNFVGIAVRVIRFATDRLTLDGRLQRTWKDGRAHIPAFLDDYAELIGGALAVHQSWPVYGPARDQALAWTDQAIDLFWDDTQGAFFTTGRDAEPLVVRSKTLIGGAEPSGNATMALVMAKLGVLTGRKDLLERSARLLRVLQPVALRAPRALGIEAIAAAWHTSSIQELGIVFDGDVVPDAPAGDLVRALHQRYAPLAVVEAVDWRQADSSVPAWMLGRGLKGGKSTAYLCERGACGLPTNDRAELARQLDQSLSPRGAS